tara:strand:+ start:535 stop:783 length:249 start_codon:yes stop_codon:yes gene_type:complete
MNGRKAKAIRRRGKDLLIEWLRSVVPEGEDTSKINRKTLQNFLSDQTHFYANRKIMLSAYSLKWIYKQLKRNPNFTLEDLNG